MKTTFKILTKKGPGHRETEVTIDWTGISEEDLKILAKSAIVRDLQARLKVEDGEFPTTVMILAKEVIHHDQPAQWECQQPSKARQYETIPPAASKAAKQLDKLLKTLSPDEVKTLLA